LFDGTRAPSTVGSWLRAHKWSNVRQLDAISCELLKRLWAAGAGPSDLAGPLTIDLDSTIVQVHGRAKQGAAFGYTKVRGYRPQLATCAQTGQVLMSRLRGGSAGAARGAASIRLHDLRHTATSLALAAGVPLKVVSEQLGHSSLAITADTYTSVLPAVAAAAAEAVADVIPRAIPGGRDAGAFPFRSHPAPQEDQMTRPNPRQATKPPVRGLPVGAPPGTRTPNPRIKSPLLCQLS